MNLQKPTVKQLHSKTRKPSIEDLPDVGDDEKKEVESPAGYEWEIANWIYDIGGSVPTAYFGAYTMSHDGYYYCKPIDFIYVYDKVEYRIPSDPLPRWSVLAWGEQGWDNWCLANLEWIAWLPVVWEAKARSVHKFKLLGITYTFYGRVDPVIINDITK